MAADQTQAHLAVQLQQNRTHIQYTPDNFLFFFLFLSLSEEAFSAQHECLKEEKESLTKLQKECTAKRYE